MKRFIFIALWTLVSPLFAGEGSGSHGADLEKDQANIWFMGDEPVEYCVKVDSTDFEVRARKTLFEDLIRESVGEWQTFFNKYRLDQIAFRGKQMSFDFRRIATCNAPEKQILFLLAEKSGTKKNGEAEDSYGHTVRLPYNHKTLRTGGTVWVNAEIVKNKLLLKHIILHELGHVFGMAHNSTWVMYEKTGDIVKSNYPVNQTLLGKIEAPSWHYRLRKGDSLALPILEGTLPKELVAGLDDKKEKPAVTLTYRGLDKNERTRFQLEFEDPDGKRNLVDGIFQKYHSVSPDGGPSLYTTRDEVDTYFVRFFLETLNGTEENHFGYFPTPNIGMFYLNGKVYPAVIEDKFGTVVKLFLTDTNEWIALSGLHLSNIGAGGHP